MNKEAELEKNIFWWMLLSNTGLSVFLALIPVLTNGTPSSGVANFFIFVGVAVTLFAFWGNYDEERKILPKITLVIFVPIIFLLVMLGLNRIYNALNIEVSFDYLLAVGICTALAINTLLNKIIDVLVKTKKQIKQALFGDSN